MFCVIGGVCTTFTMFTFDMSLKKKVDAHVDPATKAKIEAIKANLKEAKIAAFKAKVAEAMAAVGLRRSRTPTHLLSHPPITDEEVADYIAMVEDDIILDIKMLPSPPRHLIRSRCC